MGSHSVLPLTPDIEKNKNGYYYPYWETLIYIRKLSEQITPSKDPDLAKKIIEFIKEVDTSKKYNERTYTSLIYTLSNIPNDLVPENILGRVSLWHSENNANDVFGHEHRSLLIKFLHTGASEEDLKKGKSILANFLTLKENNDQTSSSYYSNSSKSYKLRTNVSSLYNKVKEKRGIPIIAEKFSKCFIDTLESNIKKLALDYPNEIKGSLKIKGNDVECLVIMESNNLRISIGKATDLIQSFDSLSKKDIKTELISI